MIRYALLYNIIGYQRIVSTNCSDFSMCDIFLKAIYSELNAYVSVDSNSNSSSISDNE